MRLFLFHILTSISVIVMIVYGLWYHYAISLLVYFFTGCIGMTVTYHRLLSHKSFTPRRGFEKFGTLCATLGGTGSSIAWVAVHREHHRYTDTKLDPHSPKFKNWYSVQFLSMFFKPHVKYAVDLLRSPFHTWVHRNYWLIHLFYALVLIFIDPFSIVYAYLFPSFILWHAGSFINSLCHYRNNDKRIGAKNVDYLGYLVWGEGYHSNHHTDPKNPKFSSERHHLDIGYFCIKYFCSK